MEAASTTTITTTTKSGLEFNIELINEDDNLYQYTIIYNGINNNKSGKFKLDADVDMFELIYEIESYLNKI